MKGRYLIPIFAILVSVCQGQNNLANGDSNQNPYSKRIEDFIRPISQHHYSTKEDLIRSIFRVAHRKFLRNYKAYSQPEDIFSNRTYDCLSGTYFLSLVFERLHIDYKLIETNYHIFIIAQTERGEILLETTDRFGGMITDAQKIKEKILLYKEFNRSNKNFYLSSVEMYNEISPEKLLGLLYFNKAIVSFKKNELVESSFFLEQSWKIYDNARIETFTPILLKAIETRRVNLDIKEDLLLKLRTHQSASTRTWALAN
ncbi:MAG TPA: hypothetical protein DGG95_06910 [Cytophagales bacterium]|jgi:hypothetical protein|nr:hypothetical protein [Cytophagales bacterium]